MLDIVLTELADKSNESVKKRYEKLGESQSYFGVLKGDINKLAKKYKNNSELAIELWLTENLDAQLLAINLFDAKKLTETDINKIINEKYSLMVLDPFVEKVLINNVNWRKYEQQYLNSSSLIYQRLGWRLRVKYFSKKGASDNEIDEVLKVIEDTMNNSEEIVRWTMNYCLVIIAVNYEKYLNRCIEIGESIGLYKEQKVAKGCTSAYAPAWISAVLKNKKK